MSKPLPSPEVLRELLDYDPYAGTFRWKERSDDPFNRWNIRFSGRLALTAICGGYRRGKVGGVAHYAHRVAWAIHFGSWPPQQIDHINGDRGDNRIANLRVVDDLENSRNQQLSKRNKAGAPGLAWIPRWQRWQVCIGVEGKNIYVGGFPSIEEAVAARRAAEREYGFHPNHGRSPAPA